MTVWAVEAIQRHPPSPKRGGLDAELLDVTRVAKTRFEHKPATHFNLKCRTRSERSTVEPGVALDQLIPVSVVILQTPGTANTVRTKSTTVNEGRSD